MDLETVTQSEASQKKKNVLDINIYIHIWNLEKRYR